MPKILQGIGSFYELVIKLFLHITPCSKFKLDVLSCHTESTHCLMLDISFCTVAGKYYTSRAQRLHKQILNKSNFQGIWAVNLVFCHTCCVCVPKVSQITYDRLIIVNGFSQLQPSYGCYASQHMSGFNVKSRYDKITTTKSNTIWSILFHRAVWYKDTAYQQYEHPIWQTVS